MAYTRPVKVVWNAAKNVANQKKHGVSFEEAQDLLLSLDDRLDIFDEEHSALEERFRTPWGFAINDSDARSGPLSSLFTLVFPGSGP